MHKVGDGGTSRSIKLVTYVQLTSSQQAVHFSSAAADSDCVGAVRLSRPFVTGGSGSAVEQVHCGIPSVALLAEVAQPTEPFCGFAPAATRESFDDHRLGNGEK